MKLLIDMSLSPGWIQRLAQHGLEAIHWSIVGPATAPDEEVLSWARDRGYVVVTHDLDFSATLGKSIEERSCRLMRPVVAPESCPSDAPERSTRRASAGPARSPLRTARLREALTPDVHRPIRGIDGPK